MRLQVHNTHKSRSGQIWTWDRHDVRGLDEARGVRFATLNIRSGRAGGLEETLRALNQDNLDVG